MSDTPLVHTHHFQQALQRVAPSVSKKDQKVYDALRWQLRSSRGHLNPQVLSCPVSNNSGEDNPANVKLDTNAATRHPLLADQPPNVSFPITCALSGDHPGTAYTVSSLLTALPICLACCRILQDTDQLLAWHHALEGGMSFTLISSLQASLDVFQLNSLQVGDVHSLTCTPWRLSCFRRPRQLDRRVGQQQEVCQQWMVWTSQVAAPWMELRMKAKQSPWKTSMAPHSWSSLPSAFGHLQLHHGLDWPAIFQAWFPGVLPTSLGVCLVGELRIETHH